MADRHKTCRNALIAARELNTKLLGVLSEISSEMHAHGINEDRDLRVEELADNVLKMYGSRPMTDANTVRQEVEARVRTYADHILSSLAGAHGTLHGNVPEDEEIIYGIALELALAERQKVSDQFIEMLSTFELHRAADKETGPRYRGECHPNCKACELVAAVRSQAATERGEGKVKV